MSKDVNVGGQSGAVTGASRRRPRRWFRVLTLLVLICAAGAAAGYYFKFGVLKWSEPYQMALDKLKTDQRLAGQIGEPIQDATWFPSGEINNDPNLATARLFFDVAGPKGRAHVQVDGRRMDNKQWELTQLAASLEGGNRIVINVGSESGLDEAPRWPP